MGQLLTLMRTTPMVCDESDSDTDSAYSSDADDDDLLLPLVEPQCDSDAEQASVDGALPKYLFAVIDRRRFAESHSVNEYSDTDQHALALFDARRAARLFADMIDGRPHAAIVVLRSDYYEGRIERARAGSGLADYVLLGVLRKNDDVYSVHDAFRNGQLALPSADEVDRSIQNAATRIATSRAQ